MDHKTWGGSRAGAGRPRRSDNLLIRTSVGLTEEQQAYCRKLGGGVIARGVRKVVDAYPDLLGALENLLTSHLALLAVLENVGEEAQVPESAIGVIEQARAAVAGARREDVQE